MARERKPRPVPGTPKPRRSTRVLFASTILSLEAFVMFFAGIAIFGLRRAEPIAPWILAAALIITVACIMTCSLLKKPLGYWIGWIIQIVMVLFGFLEPMMFFVGILFAITWWYGVTKGRMVDLENKRRDEKQAEWERENLAKSSPENPGPTTN